jgi:hypothetical protein
MLNEVAEDAILSFVHMCLDGNEEDDIMIGTDEYTHREIMSKIATAVCTVKGCSQDILWYGTQGVAAYRGGRKVGTFSAFRVVDHPGHAEWHLKYTPVNTSSQGMVSSSPSMSMCHNCGKMCTP